MFPLTKLYQQNHKSQRPTHKCYLHLALRLFPRHFITKFSLNPLIVFFEQLLPFDSIDSIIIFQYFKTQLSIQHSIAYFATQQNIQEHNNQNNKHIMGDNPRKYQPSWHREGKKLILHDFKFDLKQSHRQQSLSIKSNRRSMPNLSISKRQSFQEPEQFPEKKLPPISKIQTLLFNPSQQKQETQTRKLKQPPIRRNKTLNKKIELPERTTETIEEALSKHETSKKIFYIKNLALDSNIEQVQPKKNTLVKMKQQQVNRKTNNLRKFFKQITNTPSQLITYTMNYTSTNSFKRKQFQPLKFEQKSHRKPKKNEEEHLVDGWNIRTSNGDMFEHLYNMEAKKTA